MEMPQSRLLPFLNPNQRPAQNGVQNENNANVPQTSEPSSSFTAISEDFNMLSLSSNWYPNSSGQQFIPQMDARSSRSVSVSNSAVDISSSIASGSFRVPSNQHSLYVPSSSSRSIGHSQHPHHHPYHTPHLGSGSAGGVVQGHGVNSKYQFGAGTGKNMNNNVIMHAHQSQQSLHHQQQQQQMMFGGGVGLNSHASVAAAMMQHSPLSPQANALNCFLSSDIHTDIFNKSIELFSHAAEYQQTVSTPGVILPALIPPFEVNTYKYVIPLDPHPMYSSATKSSVYNCVTSCYSALDSRDGLKYFLRRVHSFRPASSKFATYIESWKKVSHPNVVRLKEVFTTKSFGDFSTVFVYDYLPSVTTLSQRIVATAASSTRSTGTAPKILFPENLIWNYIVQLTSAMRTIHSSGLACRCIDVSKILIDSRNRLYLNGCCILDVLLCDSYNLAVRAEIAACQQDDMKNLGKVTMALACGSVLALLPENFKSSYDLIFASSPFSEDLRNFINYLFTNSNRSKTLMEIMPMIGARFYAQFEASELRGDQLEKELLRQVHSGRLLRLMAKLASINERSEFNLDPSWSETGDRYLLKLFRDYVFHQVTEDGVPWLDISHIITCMNKLDCGVNEKLMLVSRDNQNALVVTYADLRLCLENIFAELSTPTLTRSDPTGGGMGGAPDHTLMVPQNMPYSAVAGSTVGAGDAAVQPQVQMQSTMTLTSDPGQRGVVMNGVGHSGVNHTGLHMGSSLYNGSVD